MFMSDEQFGLLKDLIAREFGIVMKGDKRLTLHTKISHRLSILGMQSYGDYCRYVSSEPSKKELYNIASHITNNETYFFREKHQLNVFSELLNDIKRYRQKKNQNRVRVLSAGCSSGEETYTLNILLMESGLFAWGWDVIVEGIDVSSAALKRAKSAEYTKNSFRMLNGNHEFAKKYFDHADDKFILKKPYRNNVGFLHANVLQPGAFEGISDVDVIFCRNILIYMSDEALERIALNFYNCISDRGYLILGSSESLLQRTELFVPEYRNGIILYRKNPNPPSALRQE